MGAMSTAKTNAARMLGGLLARSRRRRPFRQPKGGGRGAQPMPTAKSEPLYSIARGSRACGAPNSVRKPPRKRRAERRSARIER